MAFRLFERKTDGALVEYFLDYADTKKNLTEFYTNVAVDKIAKTISRLGFIVVTNDESQKRKIEYCLNVSPNINQNASTFWYNTIRKMLLNPDGAVIVKTNSKGYFLADSFSITGSVIDEVEYYDITLEMNGNCMSMNNTYKANDIIHMKYSNEKLAKLREAVNNSVSSAYSVALVGFKSKAPKVSVRVDAGLKIKTKEGKVITSNAYAEEVAKKYSSDEIKSILLQDGIDVNTLENKSSLSADDIDKLRNVVIKDVSLAFDIPLKTMICDFDKDSDTEFITHACLPVISVLNDAINFSWVGEESYLKGEKIIVDIRNTRHVSIVDNANNLDKLFMNGFTFNYIMDSLGYPLIDEEWANKPRFTKNYATEEELRASSLIESKGGG